MYTKLYRSKYSTVKLCFEIETMKISSIELYRSKYSTVKLYGKLKFDI